MTDKEKNELDIAAWAFMYQYQVLNELGIDCSIEPEEIFVAGAQYQKYLDKQAVSI